MAKPENKTERLFRKIGLSGKLSFMVSMIALLVFVPSIIIGGIESFKQSMSSLEQYKNSLEIRIQKAYEPAIWNYDINSLRELITTELQDKNLSSIRITSGGKKLIWLKYKDNKAVDAILEPEGRYIERRDIEIQRFDNDGQIFANATIWYDNSESRNRLFRGIRYELYQTGLIILFIAGTITGASYIRLVKPLESIRKSMIEAGKSLHNAAREKIGETSFKNAFPEISSMAEDLEHMFLDIDEAYEQVRKSETMFKAIFQQAGVGVAMVNPHIRSYLLVNQRFCDIVGYSMDAISNLTFEEITHSDDFPMQETLLKRLLSGEIREHTFEKRYIRNDGKIVWAQVTLTPLWAPGENPTSQIAVIQDITERRMVEEEIKKLNDELETKVIERTLDLEQANIELEAAIEDLRAAQSQLVSHEKMAVLGQLVSGIAHEINTPLGVITSAGGTLEHIIYDEINQVIEFCIKSPEEVTRIYREFLSIGLKLGYQSDHYSKRQIKKRYYKILDEKGLIASDEVIECLVDIGYDQDEDEFTALIQKPGTDDAVRAAYSIITMHNSVNMIRRSAEKASKVISALKTYSHKEPNAQVVAYDVINDIEMVLILYYNQTKFGVEIIKNYENVPPVLCIPDKLHQIWVNIINNALQAMECKGVINIGVARDDDFVRVSINDNGPGIPDSIRKKIFEPFFTTKKLGEGTGLGLDIVKRTVDEIGGRISVESQPGSTTFNVWLRT